jgi:hypothetical protein
MCACGDVTLLGLDIFFFLYFYAYFLLLLSLHLCLAPGLSSLARLLVLVRVSGWFLNNFGLFNW